MKIKKISLYNRIRKLLKMSYKEVVYDYISNNKNWDIKYIDIKKDVIIRYPFCWDYDFVYIYRKRESKRFGINESFYKFDFNNKVLLYQKDTHEDHITEKYFTYNKDRKHISSMIYKNGVLDAVIIQNEDDFSLNLKNYAFGTKRAIEVLYNK